MSNKIIGIFICMLMIATAIPATSGMNVHPIWDMKETNNSEPCQSELTFFPGLIKIKITGIVTDVIDDNNILGEAIHVDDIITGKYIYYSGASDLEPYEQLGYYEFTSFPCGMEINAGGFVFKTNPSNVDCAICIYNDFDYYGNPPFDAYEVWSDGNKPLSNGMLVTGIYWGIADVTATALSSTDLPVTAPVLTDWGSGYGLTIQGEDPSDSHKHFTIYANVTEATKNSAVDVYDAESGWGTSLIAGRFSNKPPFMYFWERIFERFPHAFPILRYLMA